MTHSMMLVRAAPREKPHHDIVVGNAFVFKTTDYFRFTRTRPDRASIRLEWIAETVRAPEAEAIQHDGRIRR